MMDYTKDSLEIILDYAKAMGYSLHIQERNRKWFEEVKEFEEAIDFNLINKLEEEGADVQITTALRQIASGINPREALINKIKADLKKKGLE